MRIVDYITHFVLGVFILALAGIAVMCDALIALYYRVKVWR